MVQSKIYGLERRVKRSGSPEEDAEQQLSWEADKAALDQRFFQGIAENLKAKNIRLLRKEPVSRGHMYVQ